MAESLDYHEAPMETTPGEKDVTLTEIPLKHENTNIERDSQLDNVFPMIDAEKETVLEYVERPVDSNRLMEPSSNAVINGSNGAMNLEGSVNKETSKKEGKDLREKNTGLQALWENLTKERDTVEQTTSVSDQQQSSEMAANCEAHENEIQKLRQEVEEAARRYKALEKSYSDCKAENQRLEELVLVLRARITKLESEGVTEKTEFTVSSENKTQAAEVVEAQKDDLREIEDALNEGFATQESKTTAEMPADKPTGEGADVGDDKSSKPDDYSSPTGKLPGHSSLPRKFSSTSTAPMPFKLHTPSSSSHSSASSRQRTRSVDHTTGATDRRESVGSDTSDSLPSDAGNDGKPRFMQKKFSASHLDAFKPKPFKKQTSLADDFPLLSRQRKNSGSKTESTGSACDPDATQEISVQQENLETTQQATDSTDSSPVEKLPAKVPPHTLPKPHKATEKPDEKPDEQAEEKPAFQSGFSKKDYYSCIRPQGTDENEQATPPIDVTQNQDYPKEIVHSSEDKGELV